MNHIFSAALALAASIFTISAQHSAIDPQPRGDDGWKRRQASFNERVKEVGKKSQLIFIGDSITQGWEGAGKDIWADRYAKFDAINLDIGGEIYKLELNGTVVGRFGKAGKAPREFASVNQMDCRQPNVIYTAESAGFRVQKVTLRP